MKTISAKETAKIIKSILKAAFPGQKFSIRSDHNAINIKWFDGPMPSQVTPLVSVFKSQGFDGMIDMSYSLGDCLYQGEKVHFSSAYVFCNREFTKEFLQNAANKVSSVIGIKAPEISETGDYGARILGDANSTWVLYRHFVDSNGHFEICSDSGGGSYLSQLILDVAAHTSTFANPFKSSVKITTIMNMLPTRVKGTEQNVSDYYPR